MRLEYRQALFQLVAIWQQTDTGRLLGNIDPVVVRTSRRYTRGGLRPVNVCLDRRKIMTR